MLLLEQMFGEAMERVILHSDANSFFASVEAALDPSLKDKAVAVCGAVEERHGIVLAQSIKARRAGVRTGMTVAEAKKCLPELITVKPHYDMYANYSKELRRIYNDYAFKVEPFGLDECWLDLSTGIKTFKDGVFVAETLKEQVKRELDITVSVGVSFNKIFAKLGSDLKKPDAVTLISPQNYKKKIFPLPVNALFGVGRSTAAALRKYGINTVGALAQCSPDFLRSALGKTGHTLWVYANGLDYSPVLSEEERPPVKSVGNGMTPPADLKTDEEVHDFILWLSLEVGRRLRAYGLVCRGVSLSLRDTNLAIKQYQVPLERASDDSGDIAAAAYALFADRAGAPLPLRSLTVTAIGLSDVRAPAQTDFFSDPNRGEKKSALNRVMDAVCDRYGNNALLPASLCGRGFVSHCTRPFAAVSP
ncbi:MAG: DNA polymerase IV [Ruminococcaceae bacterium]|nr:DNA polymerase IV [Oscillospiraceae bacterium]